MWTNIGFPDSSCACGCGSPSTITCGTCTGVPLTLTCTWTYNSNTFTFPLTWALGIPSFCTSPTSFLPPGGALGGWYSGCIPTGLSSGCSLWTAAEYFFFCRPSTARGFELAARFYSPGACAPSSLCYVNFAGCPGTTGYNVFYTPVPSVFFQCSPFVWSGGTILFGDHLITP